MKKIFILLLISISGFLALACPALGYGFDKDRSFVFNRNISDSPLGLKRPLFQTHPPSSNFSLYEDYWGRLGSIPIPYHQGSPGLGQRFCFLQRNYVKQGNFSSPTIRRKLVGQAPEPYGSGQAHHIIDYRRASLIGGLNVAAITVGFREAIDTWGESRSRFHVKDDWKGDGLAQTDELSHFMWGYKMTQFLYWAYEWVGFSPKTSRTLSVCQSSLILTLVEYPIDAYNRDQGLGVSDLIFNYMGVGMAVAKKHSSWLSDFDFKLSWKKNILSQNKTVFAQTYEEFDNFIYWLAYRTKIFFPKKLLCLGLGYSATRSEQGPRREFYGGIGLSIPDLASLFSQRAGDFCKPLEILYPNIRMKF